MKARALALIPVLVLAGEILAGSPSGAQNFPASGRQAAPGWTVVQTDFARAFLSVVFIDARTGWVAGEAGLVMRSDDGGLHWRRQTSGVPSALQAIVFTDRNRGWAAGNLGVMIHTEDGGAHWSPQATGTGRNLYTVHFSDERTGLAAGQDTILGTTDGGATWRAILAEKLTIEQLHMRGGRTGCAVGGTGLILKTSDAGKTWARRSVDIMNSLQAVSIADDVHWFAVGLGPGPNRAYCGVIFGSSDGAETWTRKFVAPAYLNDVYFPDAAHGWAVGEKGTILATADGGASWRAQETGRASHLQAVFFADAKTGWAVGDGGLLLRTTTGGRAPD